MAFRPAMSVAFRALLTLVLFAQALDAGAVAVPPDPAWRAIAGPAVGEGAVLSVEDGAGGVFIAAERQLADGTARTSIHHWDGVTWRALGTELAGTAAAFVVDPRDREVLVGGDFALRASGPRVNLARFRAGAWQPVAGVGSPVTALAWEARRERFYVGLGRPATAQAPILLALDGNTLAPLPLRGRPSSLDSSRIASIVIRPDLDMTYVGGAFLLATGEGDEVASVAQFDGATWSALPPGAGIGEAGGVMVWEASSGTLLAASVSGWSPLALKRWNGEAWSEVAPAIEDARAVAVSPRGGVVVGHGRGGDNGESFGHVSVLGSDGWRRLPVTVGSGRHRLGWIGSRILLMGHVRIEQDGEDYSPLSLWDGLRWGSAGSRTTAAAPLRADEGGGGGTSRLGGPTALAWGPDGVLYAGGLGLVDGRRAPPMARWGGRLWSQPSRGLTSGRVTALVRDDATASMIVAGEALRAGSTSLPAVVRWRDGLWEPIGEFPSSGVSVGAVVPVPATQEIYVAWNDWSSTWRISRWTGTAWQELPVTLSGDFRSMAVDPATGQLFVGGRLASSWGGDAPVLRIVGSVVTPLGAGAESATAGVLHWDAESGRLWAGLDGAVSQWTGSEWEPIGTGSPRGARVLLPMPGGGILAAGRPGSEPADGAPPGIARWDGAAWVPFGPGFGMSGDPAIGASAAAISPDGAWLAVGGHLQSIAGHPGAIAMTRLGATANRLPRFTEGPVLSGVPRVGGWMTVRRAAVDPDGRVVRFGYQWLRDGMPIRGAIDQSYRVEADDVGTRLSALVFASDGIDDVVGYTEAVQVASPSDNSAPNFLGVPAISGNASAGYVLTLGGLDAEDADGDRVSTAIEWTLDGWAISGQTGTTLAVPTGWIGRSIGARVTISDGERQTSRLARPVVVANAPPIARSDGVVSPLRPSLVLPRFLLANDTDNDGHALVASLVTGPARGVAEVRPDGTLSLSGLPVDAPYNDLFTYSVCDTLGQCSTGFVYLEFEAGLLSAVDEALEVENDVFAVEVPVDATGSSARAVASVVDLRRMQAQPERARAVDAAAGRYVMSLHPNLADVPVAYTVEFRAHTGAGGIGGVRVRASSPDAPSLACAGDAGRTSRCLIDVELPPRSPGLVFEVEAEPVMPNLDDYLVPFVDYVIHDLDDVGLHGGVVAIAPKQVDAGTPVQVRLVGDVPGVRHEPTVIEGRVELRDGPGGALLGERTFRVTPRGLRPAARVVTPGRPAFVPLSRQQVYYGNIQHERLRVPVPAGTHRVMVTVDGPVGAAYLVEGPVRNMPDVPSREQSVPDFATGGLRLPLERDAQGRLVKEVNGITREGRTWTLELSGGLPAGVTSPAGWAPSTARVEVQYEVATPPYSVQPGHYFNPGRDGHGVFVERGGTQMVAWWYAYEADGSPTWYMAQADAPAPGLPFAADAYRVTWSLEGGATLHDVGQVVLTPEYGGTLGFSYEVDGATGQERLVSLSEGGCLPIDGVSVDGAGSWFSPERPGFGYSVMWDARTAQEIMVTYAYDADGLPRWGYAQAPANPAAVAELPIVQLSGFAPDAAWRPLVNLGRIGTLRRTIGTMPQDGQPGLRRASVAMAFTGPVTGAFVQDLETALLTNRRTCR